MRRKQAAVTGGALIILGVVFLADSLVDFEATVSILYVLPVGLSVFSNRQNVPLVLAVISSPLIAVAAATHPSTDIDIAIANHVMALVAVWAIALVAVYQLRTAEQGDRLASIVSWSSDAIIGKSLDGIVTSWNKSAERLYGYTASEMVGRSIEAIIPAERRKELSLILERIRDGERVDNFETVRTAKNGGSIHVSITVSPIVDRAGRVTGASSTAHDTSLRRRAEEQRNRLFNLSIDMICFAGFDGYFKQLNPAWNRSLGWNDKDLSARPYIEYVHPDDRERTMAAASDLAKGLPVTGFVNRYRCADGSYKWLSWSSYPIVEEGVVLAIARDVTRQIEDEAALREANRELVRTNQELDSFSYSVSHDLRAPLRVADGFSLAVLEDYGDKLDPAAKDYLTRIRGACQRMGVLIDDILILSRVARSEMKCEDISLSAIARSVASDLKRTNPDREVLFEIEDGLHAHADPRLIRIALDNLIGNAWKFTSKKPSAKIQFGTEPEGDEDVFYVRDNGAGFDMAYSEKLFLPFQRLHSTEDFPGTGIGLATAQRILARHGGRIWAEGVAGEGAVFRFTLSGRK
ncbi:MAG: PAS domain S-box protein [Candidatus Thermoplasmatota archaeon]